MHYINQFNALFGNWKDAYARASYSYVFIKKKDGNQIMSAKITLETLSTPSPSDGLRFETEHYCAGRFTKAITPDQTAVIVQMLSQGKLKRITVELHFPSKKRRMASTPTSFLRNTRL